MTEKLKLDTGFEEVPLDEGFEEVQAEIPVNEPVQEEPGMLGALAHGGLQGVSFGFSDEAEAKARSLMNKTTYEDELDKVRERYKQYEEAHPMTTVAGEIAGGFIPALASAPVAAAAGVHKLGTLGRIAAGAVEGAGIGALTGAGKAEDNVSGEVKSGALMGAGVGGAIPIVGKGLSKLGSLMKSKNAPEFVQEIADSFDLGKKGKGLISTGSVQEIESKVANTAKDVVDSYSNYLNDLTSLKTHILQNTDKSVNVSDIFRKVYSSLNGIPEASTTLKRIQQIQQSFGDQIPLKEVDSLVKTLRSYTSLGKDPIGASQINSLVSDLTDRYTKMLSDSEVKSILKNAPDQIKESYDRLLRKPRISQTSDVVPFGSEPNYNDILDLKELPLKDINDSISSTLNSSEMLKNITGDITPVEGMISEEKVAKFIRGLKKASDSGEQFRNRFSKSISELKKSNPELASQIESRVEEVSNLHNLSRAARGVKQELGEGSASGKGLVSGLLGDIKGMAGVAPANLLGQSYGAASHYSKAPEKLLHKVADRFGENSAIGKMVREAAASPDENKRRATMNALMQMSTFRQMLKDDEDGEENR